jgi:Rrf2 family transcriptional regulator, cysteine metabolism repressor
MISITKKADYGLVFLHALSKEAVTSFIPLKKLTESVNLPYKFLSQIASELKAKGLIESKEGLGGGYRLTKTPQETSIGEVIRILEGETAPVSCLRGKLCQRQATCPHKQIMVKLAAAVDATMNQYTLADLNLN